MAAAVSGQRRDRHQTVAASITDYQTAGGRHCRSVNRPTCG
ncbi:hypothetical protein DIJ64_06645 [Mycobacterium leprae]|uniref:Uncharacterized protein n=1 Tax=Mycobacterium leprae TaxID=1769 RepID=A0AAD0P7S8_MYCLR|nr:hypothetical protein DIJ64_06645 [Mycobacterium leprae]